MDKPFMVAEVDEPQAKRARITDSQTVIEQEEPRSPAASPQPLQPPLPAAAAPPAAVATAGAGSGAVEEQPTPAAAAGGSHNEQQQQQQHGSLPATPSASVSQESDLTHGQQWWLPQPQPSLDEEHSEWRPAVPLVEALQCRVCSDLLKEAITAAECGHSYCYDCIDQRIAIGGRANFCPVCNVLLGPNPFEHNKLKYDFILDSLVRKVFPRPLLDAALEGRRLDREEATRQAKATINKRPGRAGFVRSLSSSQLVAAGSGRATAALISPDTGEFVELALFPVAGGAASATANSSHEDAAATLAGQQQQQQAAVGLAPLPRPYIRAPSRMTVGGLKSWLADRLEGKRGQAKVAVPQVELLCCGQVLEPHVTLQQVQDDVWMPHTRNLPAGPGTAPQQQDATAAAAAAAAAEEASRTPAGQLPYSGEHVMLLLYQPASLSAAAADS